MLNGGPQQPVGGYQGKGMMNMSAEKSPMARGASVSQLTEENLDMAIALIGRLESMHGRLSGTAQDLGPNSQQAPPMPISEKLQVMKAGLSRAHELLSNIDQKLF